jgi:hypothetical protein
MPPPAQQTIDGALEQFLAEQRERLSPRTFRNYAEVVELLRHSLDGYAYSPLDDEERARWEEAFEADEERAFCRLFGPEKIPEHLGEFLGYFMVRKVIAGQELLKAGDWQRADIRIAGIHLCSLVRRALTRSASADLHCHPAGADRQSRAARQGRAKRAAKRRPHMEGVMSSGRG